MSALQLLQSSWCCSHLQPAYRVKTALAIVVFQRVQLLHRILCQLAHRFGPGGLENEPRSMRRRASRHMQRALLDDRDVVASAGNEFISEVGADYAGSDNDDPLRGRHCARSPQLAQNPPVGGAPLFVLSSIRTQDEHTVHGNEGNGGKHGSFYQNRHDTPLTPQDRVARISPSSDIGLGLAVPH